MNQSEEALVPQVFISNDEIQQERKTLWQ